MRNQMKKKLKKQKIPKKSLYLSYMKDSTLAVCSWQGWSLYCDTTCRCNVPLFR